MNYTRMQFGKELKAKILLELDVTKIADWAYLIYLEHEESLEINLKDILLRLNKMENGPEFALSHELLNKIADDLIVNKIIDVKNKDYYKETNITRNKHIQAKFGFELKNRVLQKQEYVKISEWAHSVYTDCGLDVNDKFLELLLDFTAMECGPEYAISYKMLNKIADDLIAGKDIDLNAKEYREKEI